MSLAIKHRLSLFAVLVVLPVGLFAATAESLIKATDTAAVNRGEFIHAAVTALDLPAQTVELPYKRRVSAAQLPSVRTAYAMDALDVFGSELHPSRSITRGEAAFVLLKLHEIDEASPQKKTVLQREEAALRVGISLKWFNGSGKTGTDATAILKGKEAKAAIQTIAVTQNPDGTKQPAVPIIQVQPKQRGALPNDEMLRVIWQLLNTQYLHKDKLDGKEAAYAAAEAIVKSAGDPYTTFLRPAPAKELQSQLEGEVTGIGAQVEFKDSRLIIVAPIKDSPAEKAGLKAGDIVLSVNNESLEGLNFSDSVAKIRGPKGSTALVKVLRGEIEQTFTIVRDTVKVSEIEITWEGRVAIVRLMQFGQRTDKELRGLLTEVQTKNPQGIVLDLRNNPGGLLHAADTVVSNFLPKGSVVANIVATDSEYQEKTADAPTIKDDVPVVVLVNKGSASASEIVAGVLQDAKRAKVVGTQSFGKGTVQQILEFNDGSGLKMTIAEWLTPLRRKIDGIGIKPDFIVEPIEGGRDFQMDKAMEVLRS